MTADGFRRHLAALGAAVDALGPEVETITLEGARRHLIAIRASVDAMLAELYELIPTPPEARGVEVGGDGAADAATCPHPEEDRQDAASLRNPNRFRCRRCRQLVNP